MALLAHEPGRYLRSPLLSREQHTTYLYALASLVENEQVLRWQLDSAGEPVHKAETITEAAALVSFEPGSPLPAASDDPRNELRARQDGWQVEIVRNDEGASVQVTLPGNHTLRIWAGPGLAAAPAIAVDKGGAWVAFHHNVREDTGISDVVNWIALRFVSKTGEVFKAVKPMRDRDRDRAGEEQGFEFPSLCVTESGSVLLIGRGSHAYWKQELDASGWSAREALGEAGWGARGRRVAVLLHAGGSVLTARRERKGIEIQTLRPSGFGAPELERVDVPEPQAHGGYLLAHAEIVEREEDPAQATGRTTLFGDLQQHSAHSDGCGSAWEAYWRARYIYKDDFFALTDHESFLGKRIGPGEWRYLQQVADACQSDNFVTLIAYEWTGKAFPGPGHKVVYCPDVGLPIVSRDSVPEGRELVQQIQAQGAFTRPHHIGWTGADIPGHTPIGQPVWEICSCHGCYEHPNHPLGARGQLRDQMVDSALRSGLHFGFIASSDSHGLLWHHGECRKRDPFRTGLTGVQATARTRSAVFNAIKERRCYATSGAKILLDFQADSEPMGSELTTHSSWSQKRESKVFSAKAYGTSNIKRLVFIGPDGIVAEQTGRGKRAELKAELQLPYVYARVEQDDSEMAWSSPIFSGQSHQGVRT